MLSLPFRPDLSPSPVALSPSRSPLWGRLPARVPHYLPPTSFSPLSPRPRAALPRGLAKVPFSSLPPASRPRRPVLVTCTCACPSFSPLSLCRRPRRTSPPPRGSCEGLLLTGRRASRELTCAAAKGFEGDSDRSTILVRAKPWTWGGGGEKAGTGTRGGSTRNEKRSGRNGRGRSGRGRRGPPLENGGALSLPPGEAGLWLVVVLVIVSIEKSGSSDALSAVQDLVDVFDRDVAGLKPAALRAGEQRVDKGAPARDVVLQTRQKGLVRPLVAVGRLALRVPQQRHALPSERPQKARVVHPPA